MAATASDERYKCIGLSALAVRSPAAVKTGKMQKRTSAVGRKSVNLATKIEG
jgi:hypothetical protein